MPEGSLICPNHGITSATAASCIWNNHLVELLMLHCPSLRSCSLLFGQNRQSNGDTEVIRNPKSLKSLILTWTSASLSGTQSCFGISILLDGNHSLPFCLDFPTVIDLTLQLREGLWSFCQWMTICAIVHVLGQQDNTRHIKAHHTWTCVKIPLIVRPSQLPGLEDLVAFWVSCT